MFTVAPNSTDGLSVLPNECTSLATGELMPAGKACQCCTRRILPQCRVHSPQLAHVVGIKREVSSRKGAVLCQPWLLLEADTNDTGLQRHTPYSSCTFLALCMHPLHLCTPPCSPARLPSCPTDFILTSWNFLPSSWSAPGTSPTIICPVLESGVQWTAGNATSEG